MSDSQDWPDIRLFIHDQLTVTLGWNRTMEIIEASDGDLVHQGLPQQMIATRRESRW